MDRNGVFKRGRGDEEMEGNGVSSPRSLRREERLVEWVIDYSG